MIQILFWVVITLGVVSLAATIYMNERSDQPGPQKDDEPVVGVEEGL